MDFSKTIKTVEKAMSIVRKGQLIIKDSEKVKDVLDRKQAQRADVQKHLGPYTPKRNRYKKIEL